MVEPRPDTARGTTARPTPGVSAGPRGAAHRPAATVAVDCLLGTTAVAMAVRYRLPPIPVRSKKPATGDHVLLYGAHSETCLPCRLDVEHTLGVRPVRPPSTWHLVFTTRDRVVRVYQVD